MAKNNNSYGVEVEVAAVEPVLEQPLEAERFQIKDVNTGFKTNISSKEWDEMNEDQRAQWMRLDQ